MPDPLGSVIAGHISPLVKDAAAVNAVLESARGYRAVKQRKAGPGKVGPTPLAPANLVMVENTTGGTIPVWSVLTPSGFTIDPVAHPFETRRHPTFTASAPVTERDAVVITVDSIPAGGIGRAVAAGVAVAEVEITDTAHRYARAVPGNLFRMTSADTGPAYLYAPGGLGTRKTLVLLGAPHPEADDDGSGSDSGGGGGGGGTTRGPGWTAGLTPDNCLKLTVVSASGRCDAIDTEQELLLRWNGSAWESTEEFVYRSGSGVVLFWVANGMPHLSIGGTELVWDAAGVLAEAPGSGSGSGSVGEGGRNYVDFAGGNTLCDPEDASGSGDDCLTADCEDNIFVVRIRCVPCAGWYCVLTEGEDCDAEDAVIEPLYLEAADLCDPDIVVCSGPYETEADALAVCGPPILVACCPQAISRRLTLTVSGATGDCACAAGSHTLAYQGGTGGAGDPAVWSNVAASSVCGSYYFELRCVEGVWEFSVASAYSGTLNAGASACDPFTQVFDCTGVLMCTGAFTATITEA